MAMADEPSGLGARSGESEPPDNVVEPAFEDLKESVSGDAGTAGGLGEVTAELPFEEAVGSPQLLFLSQLDAVVGNPAAEAPLGMLAWGVGPLLDSAFSGEAALSLQVEANAFSAA